MTISATYSKLLVAIKPESSPLANEGEEDQSGRHPMDFEAELTWHD